MNIFYSRLITSSPFEFKKIISYGLIVYSKSTSTCIIVQRKHSIEFLLLLLGHYRPSILPLLLLNITYNEYQLLNQLLENNEIFFKSIFIDKIGLNENDLNYGYFRFLESKISIEQFYKLNKVNYNNLKWTWPKGKLNKNENEFQCAKREFIEEVEIKLPPSIYQSSHYFTVENINTINYTNIETRCWLYIIKNEIELPSILNHPEVNNRKWMDLKLTLKLLNQENLLSYLLSEISKCD